MSPTPSFLPQWEISLPCPRGFDREIQLVFRLVQRLLGPGAMSHHVVVVGGTSTVHLMNCLDYVLVNIIKIVPIADLCRNFHTRNKRHCKSNSYECFLHR